MKNNTKISQSWQLRLLQCLAFLPVLSHFFTDLISYQFYSLILILGCAIQLVFVAYSDASPTITNNPTSFLWDWYSMISQASQLPHCSLTLIKQVTHGFHPMHLIVIILKHRSVIVVFCLDMKHKTQSLTSNWWLGFILNYILQVCNQLTIDCYWWMQPLLFFFFLWSLHHPKYEFHGHISWW